MNLKKLEMEYFLILYVLYLELSNNFIVFTPYILYYVYLFITQQTAHVYILLFNFNKFMEILQNLSILFISNALLKIIFYIINITEHLQYPFLLSFVILATYTKRNNNKPNNIDNSNLEQLYND